MTALVSASASASTKRRATDAARSGPRRPEANAVMRSLRRRGDGQRQSVRLRGRVFVMSCRGFDDEFSTPPRSQATELTTDRRSRRWQTTCSSTARLRSMRSTATVSRWSRCILAGRVSTRAPGDRISARWPLIFTFTRQIDAATATPRTSKVQSRSTRWLRTRSRSWRRWSPTRRTS